MNILCYYEPITKQYVMIDQEKFLEALNDLVINAELNGGDSGGPYNSNEEELNASMNEFLNVINASNSVEVKKETIKGLGITTYKFKKKGGKV